MGLTVGVDVGGTKVAAGVVDEQGQVLARVRRATTAQIPGAAEKVISEAVHELASSFPVEAVGVGSRGLVDETRSIVRFAPNLGWREQPLRAQLEQATGLPVVVENDANAAAWAEYRFGAARGRDDVVMLTVGTGIGGALVLGGRLHRGRYGLAGEVGHIVAGQGRPALRLRPARLLGAVRQRQRAAARPRGTGPRRTASGPGSCCRTGTAPRRASPGRT